MVRDERQRVAGVRSLHLEPTGLLAPCLRNPGVHRLDRLPGDDRPCRAFGLSSRRVEGFGSVVLEITTGEVGIVDADAPSAGFDRAVLRGAGFDQAVGELAAK